MIIITKNILSNVAISPEIKSMTVLKKYVFYRQRNVKSTKAELQFRTKNPKKKP